MLLKPLVCAAEIPQYPPSCLWTLHFDTIDHSLHSTATHFHLYRSHPQLPQINDKMTTVTDEQFFFAIIKQLDGKVRYTYSEGETHN